MTCSGFCAPEKRILECASISEVLPLIDQDTWLLLDLDNTLFQSSQAYGHLDWLHDEEAQLVERGLTPVEAFLSMCPQWKLVQNELSMIPVEQALVDTLLKLQTQGVRALGLTHRESYLADVTLEHLNRLNIDFLRTAPTSDPFTFIAAEKVLYQGGVLFVHTFNDKGKVFRSFLEKIGHRPNKIVFLDDKLKNVEQMADMAASENISFHGIYYTAIHHTPRIYSRESARSLQPETNAARHLSWPPYLYKVISMSQWWEALHENFVTSNEATHDLRDLPSLELVMQSIEDRFDGDYLILKLSTDHLEDTVVEIKENLTSSSARRYCGKIPLQAVQEVRLNRMF